MKKQQEQRRLRRRPLTSSSDRCNAIVAALLIGLIFCLANVAVLLSSVNSHITSDDSTNASLHSKLAVIDNTAVVPESKTTETIIPKKLTPEERDALSQDKEPILNILREAGIPDIEDEKLRDLPTWTQVTRLYGDSPKIYGLDTCHEFQQHSDAAEHFVGTAGTFNSGTNLMSEYLIHNCQMTKRMEKYGVKNKGIRWQVPWGKHIPVGDDQYRLDHKSLKDANVDATNILPAVTIRDPYIWMQSMCRIHYKAFWAHDTHCPNLVPSEYDKIQFPWLQQKETVPVRVKYPEFVRHHDSLVGFWNDWYNEYVHAPFPRIIVRFEDLVFHAKQVTTAVCQCAGGEMKKKKFTYIVNSAKKGEAAHGKMEDRTSFVDAMIRYGKDTHRLDRMSREDLELARATLDPLLMEFFNYQYDEIDGVKGEAQQ